MWYNRIHNKKENAGNRCVTEMNSSHNAIDYVVTKKPTGANLLARLGLVVLYIAIGVGLLWAASIPLGVLGIVGGGVISPLVVYFVFALTWTHVSYELKYQIYTPTAGYNEVSHTVVEFAKVKRNKKKESYDSVVYRREIRDAEVIAPYDEAHRASYTDGVKRTIDFRSHSKTKNDCYFIRFSENDGSKTVIIVEVVGKIVDSFKYHNKEATEVAQTTR